MALGKSNGMFLDENKKNNAKVRQMSYNACFHNKNVSFKQYQTQYISTEQIKIQRIQMLNKTQQIETKQETTQN